jgi:hypothetical protein
MLAQGTGGFAANRMASEHRLALKFKRLNRHESDISDKSPLRLGEDADLRRFSRIGRSQTRFYRTAFDALDRRWPDHIEHHRWQQAVADGGRFLAQWGEQAPALGWTPRNLFGFAEIPERPAPSYQRLSRYDQTGLVWLPQGRRVVALTKDTAAIETPNGILGYRRYNKPALGPLGDSLDDMGARQ